LSLVHKAEPLGISVADFLLFFSVTQNCQNTGDVEFLAYYGVIMVS